MMGLIVIKIKANNVIRIHHKAVQLLVKISLTAFRWTINFVFQIMDYFVISQMDLSHGAIFIIIQIIVLRTMVIVASN
jgi:hypothetical protein